MPNYALLRKYDPETTRAQLDGIALAGAAALETYIYRGGTEPVSEPHGIRWIRSYWQRGGTWGMCVFESPNLEILDAFQNLCGTPYVDAMEVEELTNGDAGATVTGATATAITFKLPPSTAGGPLSRVSDVVGAAVDSVQRAYVSADRGTAVVLLGSAGIPRLPKDLVPIEGVVELQPADYQ